MAKKNPKSARPLNKPRSVAETLRGVRELYRDGQTSLELYPDRMPHGTMARHAQAIGRDAQMVRHGRRLVRAYTEAELERLFRLCRERKFPLGVGHIVVLTAIQDRGERRRLEIATVAERLTFLGLKALVGRRLGAPKFAVGRWRRPTTLAELADETIEVAHRWRRLIGAVERNDEELRKGKPGFVLSRAARLAIGGLNGPIQKLEKVIGLIGRSPGKQC